MWIDSEIDNIVTKFSFLKEYGFEFKFKSYPKDDFKIKTDTIVAIIYNDLNCFVIKGLRKFPLEPLIFYKLESEDDLSEIFKSYSDKEIPVYENDIDLWNRALKKKKFLTYSIALDVVSESIQNQIKKTKSFYGFKLL